METKQPSIGDRLVFSNPICEADRFATVIAKRETRFGIEWEVQLEDGTVDTISRYVGTAEDCGGYARTLNHGGIGAYLLVDGMKTTEINTPFGRRTLVRRVGVAYEYYYTVPTAAAPHGEWWVLNEQRGYVPVASNSRGLVAALAAEAARPDSAGLK